jgi:D-alanine-D-alanine ligase
MNPNPAVLRGRRLAVLFGGPSSERSISLKTAAAVRASLGRMALPHRAFEVSPRLAGDLFRHRINLAFLAVHGTQGEDGSLQGMLEVMGIPYTGSGVRASALAMHKPSAKTVLAAAGIPVPKGFSLARGADAGAGPRGIGFPCVVKPAGQGSAVGISLVRNPSRWPRALSAAWRTDPEALVEEYLEGKEITVGILGNRDLPVVEIVPRHDFYDAYSKYAPGGSRHIVPARMSDAAMEQAQDRARRAFSVLGCRHVARVDMIVTRGRGPVVLEVNTLPGLTDVSLLPEAARAAGMSFDELALRLLVMAARKE